MEIGEALREFATARGDLGRVVDMLLRAVVDETIALSEDQQDILESAILDVTHGGYAGLITSYMDILPIATWLNTLGIKHLLDRR